jgi:hypothetical protein
VLGGAIGADPQLLPGVRAELARLSWPTEVVNSALGESGTVVGAARLAVARGIETVTGGVEAKPRPESGFQTVTGGVRVKH